MAYIAARTKIAGFQVWVEDYIVDENGNAQIWWNIDHETAVELDQAVFEMITTGKNVSHWVDDKDVSASLKDFELREDPLVSDEP